MASFSLDALPSLAGRRVVVTGGNSGIGWEAARMFAARGGHVVLACRDPGRAEAAAARLREAVPGASVELQALDLASLTSVAAFAERLAAAAPTLDRLVNNAGIMAVPEGRTQDGFESQLGTNHLGHFALTARLLPLLVAAGRPDQPARVVTVSSTMHRRSDLHFDDLMLSRGYHPWVAYGQSKLANLLFTYELDRRLRAAGLPVRALACHPGYAATNLQNSMRRGAFMSWMTDLGNRLVAQSAEGGAWPTVHAALSAEVDGGDYVGPGGLFEIGGPPRKVASNRASHDRESQRRLWDLSEQLTGVRFEGLGAG